MKSGPQTPGVKQDRLPKHLHPVQVPLDCQTETTKHLPKEEKKKKKKSPIKNLKIAALINKTSVTVSAVVQKPPYFTQKTEKRKECHAYFSRKTPEKAIGIIPDSMRAP